MIRKFTAVLSMLSILCPRGINCHCPRCTEDDHKLIGPEDGQQRLALPEL